jgi:hypothetical protein
MEQTERVPRHRSRVRFTIGRLMIAIAAVAVGLTLLKPVSAAVRTIAPPLAKLLEQASRVETGFVLVGFLVVAFFVVRLLQDDEGT